jgi:sigma-B regulation protein RsbU (phosphoserine phosphatase)
LSEGGTVLGAFADAQYEQTHTDFACGDRLVLTTDGITEAMNAKHEEFGEDRLIDLLIRNRHMSAADIRRKVIDAVASFAGQALQDDATLLIVAMH